MPVNPPYSIIDTIARLRASGGEAWGNAAAGVGKSIGAGIGKMGENSQARAKDLADKHHELIMSLAKSGTIEHSLPDTLTPGAVVPQANPMGINATPGGGPMGGGRTGLPSPYVPVGAPGGPGGVASGRMTNPSILGGPNATTARPGMPPPDSLRVSELQRLAGLPVTSDADHLIWRPNASKEKLQGERERSAQTIAEAKEAGAAKTAHEKYFTPVTDSVRAEAKKANIPIGKDDKISRETYEHIKATNTSAEKAASARAAADAHVAAQTEANRIKESIAKAANGSKEQIKAMADRDAFITKNPTMSAIFGAPKDLGKPVGGEGKAAPGRVNMLDKNGKKVNLPESQVDDAISQGYTRA